MWAVKVEVATPCAIALNLVISNLSATSEKAVMEALKETETSMRIVGNRKDFAEVLANIHTRTDKATLLSKLFLLQFHSIPHKSLCILDFTRTYPLCKNPFFTFLACIFGFSGVKMFDALFYSKCKSRLKLTNARKGARCRDFSRKTWPTFLGVPLITMHME
ncbi:hypothetical protein AAZV13_13G071600 [Glycine max]